jgi:hypothetical protein
MANQMKRQIRKLLGLPSLAALAMGSLLMASPARAADYTGNCAGISAFNGSGNVDITDTACTLSQSISASGHIHITADSISAPGKVLTSVYEIDLRATGDIAVGNLTTTYSYINVQGDNVNISGDVAVTTWGNILMIAQHNLATANITGAPGLNVDLKANASGANTPFIIGGTGNANGVNGTVATQPSGNLPTWASAVMYITNGTSGSLGGITIADLSKLSFAATSSARAGYLILEAWDGTINVPSGTLSADGTATSSAGTISLQAKEIDFGNNVQISVSQPAGNPGSLHGIILSAETVKYGGPSGLVLKADGDGYAQYQNGYVQLVPKTANTIYDSLDPGNLIIYGWTNAYLAGTTTYQGSGTAPLFVSANGSNSLVQTAGYPLSFSGGDVTLQSKGATNHQVLVQNNQPSTGIVGLTFASSGIVTVDATGVGGNGGVIQFYVDKASIAGTNFNVKADGPASGDGDSGTIAFFTSQLMFDSGTKGSFSANAASSGTGNSSQSAITFYPGAASFSVGNDNGQIKFSAKGGSTSGNAGYIDLQGYGSAVTLYGAGPSAHVLDVSVPGTTGNGGQIKLTAYQGLTFDGTASYLKADSGSTSGDGGKIILVTSSSPITIGTGSSGSVDLSAKSNANGKGGTVDITSYSGITADSAHINVSAGTDKQGGTISLNAGYSSLALAGDVNADGGTGNGAGGTISLSAGGFTLPSGVNTKFVADGNGAGRGGSITVVTHWQGITVSGDNGTFSIEAKSSGSGNGGSATLTSDSAISLASGSLNVSAGTNGNGGTINVTSNSILSLDGNLSLNAGAAGSGDGGTLSLSAAGFSLPSGSNTKFVADGNGTGNGGTITVVTQSQGIIVSGDNGTFSLEAVATGFGNGGTVTLTSDSVVAIAGAAIDVSGEKKGGTINVTSNSDNIALSGTLSANATTAADGNGGTIDLVANSISLPPSSNTVLTATGSGSGSGGNISIKATASGATIGSANAQLSIDASSASRGPGGSVIITTAGTLTVNASAVNVAAGPNAGTNQIGGAIELITTSGSINASGTFQASGGSSGGGGRIDFQSAENINLADMTNLLAVGNGAGGAGGTVTLAAGTANNATGSIIYASSNISIDASSHLSQAGNVQILTADPTVGSTTVLNLLGPIKADSAIPSGSSISIGNKYSDSGLRVSTQIVSSLNGQIGFASGSGPVTVTGIAPSGAAGPFFGPVSVDGTNCTLAAYGSADLVLGGFTCSDDITIQTDSGNIRSAGASAIESTNQNGTVTFISTSGKVGTGSSAPVYVNAPFISVNYGATPASGTSVYLYARSDTTIESLSAYGDIFVVGVGNLTLSQDVITTDGNIGIQTNAGAIVVNAGKQLFAREGTLYLEAMTSITVQANASVAAFTNTTNTALGNVSLSLLAPPSLNTSVPPSNVTVLSGPAYVFFGALGFTANPPMNFMSSTGSRVLAVDTNGLPPQNIILNGGVVLSASGN